MPEKHSPAISVVEHDGYTDPPTRRVSLYGWDGTQKVKVATNSSGFLQTVGGAASGDVVFQGTPSSLKGRMQIIGTDVDRVATVSSLAGGNPVYTQILDATGTPIVSFGGGTQYSNGTLVSNPIGTLALGYDETQSQVRALRVTPTDHYLMVSVESISLGPVDQGTASTLANAWPIKITDTTEVEATIRSLPANNALNVAVTNSSGIHVDSFPISGSVAVSGGSIGLLPALTFARDKIDASGSSVIIPPLTFAKDKVDTSGSSVFASLTDKTVYPRPDVLNLSASLSNIQPSFAVITQAAAGDTCVVAATASKKIIVLQYSLVCKAADGLTWKQGTTPVTGQMCFAANGGIAEPYSPIGLFQTATGASLYLNSSLGSQISGHITYVVV